MNGIDKITAKIEADNNRQCNEIITRAKAQAEEIVSGSREMAKREYDDAVAEGKKSAEERRKRLAGSAESEAKKLILASKQKVLDLAYDRALEMLCAYPEKTAFMAGLAADASVSGDEVILMNAADREAVGEELVRLSNQKLAAAGRPHKLTLGEQTRDIRGGFYLSGGSIETNCTFEALVKAEREEGAAEAARVLFD